MNIETIKTKIKQQNKLSALKQHLAYLRQIIELTQENQSKQQTRKLNENEQQQNNKKSCFHCLTGLIQKITNCFSKKTQILEQIITNEVEFAKAIEKIKNHKIQPAISSQKQPRKKTLVLDLDQTLIHTTFEKKQFYDFTVEMNAGNKKTTGYVIKRFGLDSFLFQMSKRYQIIVFTAARKKYADLVIDKIDPKKRISHRLYRDHTISLNKTFYLKSLQVIGRKIQNTILVDDNSLAGILQPDNFYRIQPFTGSIKDRKLFQLAGFLKYLSKKNDVRSVLAHRKKYEESQILLTQQLKENIYITIQNRQGFRQTLSEKEQVASEVQTDLPEKEGKQNVRKNKARKYTHHKVNSQVEELINSETEDSAITLKIR